MRISDWSSDVCSSDLQLLAADHGIAAAVEILEDRSLLLGQPHLLLRLAVGQQLCAGAEGVGSDGEDGILALLVLTKLGAHARQQHAEAERLGDVVVGAGIEGEEDRKSPRLNSSH